MRTEATLWIGVLLLGCSSEVIIPGEDGDVSGGAGANGTGAGNGAGASGAGAGNGAGASGAGAGNGAGAGSGGGTKTEWARAFGASGAQHLRGLASDAAGHVYFTGDFGGKLDFGDGALPTEGSRSSYVTELDSKGKVAWSDALTASDCAAAALALDGAGNLFVTGTVQGTLTIGGYQAAAGDGIFVVKLDGEGKVVWARVYGSSKGGESGLGLAALPGGGVLVTGTLQGPVDFGGGPVIDSGTGVFAVAFDDGGHHVWSKGFDGLSAFVAVDEAGDAFVAANGAGDTMRVTALDGAGAELWSHGYAPGSFQGVAAGPAGVVLTGITTGADFGGGKLSDPLPAGVGFAVALDPKGQHRWTHALPFGDHQSAGAAVMIDASGNADVTGSYEHATPSGQVIQSAFLVELDSLGKELSSRKFGPTDGGGSLTQQGWGIARAKNGGVYLGGDFYSQIHVAGETLSGEGSADIFVARLAH